MPSLPAAVLSLIAVSVCGVLFLLGWTSSGTLEAGFVERTLEAGADYKSGRAQYIATSFQALQFPTMLLLI